MRAYKFDSANMGFDKLKLPIQLAGGGGDVACCEVSNDERRGRGKVKYQPMGALISVQTCKYESPFAVFG